LVERCLAKAKVAGSNPVSRSILRQDPLILSEVKGSLVSQSFEPRKRGLPKEIHTAKITFLYYAHPRCRTRIIATPLYTHPHNFFKFKKAQYMKSIMEEASSIVRAIEAAWIRAEKPQEFSVKIYEEPEKNFFGMVTKSAKIALIFKNVEKKPSYKEQAAAKYKSNSYNTAPEPTVTAYAKEHPRKDHSRHEPVVREPRESREHRETRDARESRDHREPREQYVREPREAREPREHREPFVREPRESRDHREPMVRETREPREPREQREPRERREPIVRETVRREPALRAITPARERDLSQTAPQDREFDATANQDVQERIFWNEEMIEITRVWIDTLLKNMNCSDIAFTLEPKRYYLTVSFDKPVRDTKPLEQQLFRSCAYLIMQMLRTKLKKQFRGLKVVLHSPAQ
jgi:hypothetical protein